MRQRCSVSLLRSDGRRAAGGGAPLCLSPPQHAGVHRVGLDARLRQPVPCERGDIASEKVGRLGVVSVHILGLERGDVVHSGLIAEHCAHTWALAAAGDARSVAAEGNLDRGALHVGGLEGAQHFCGDCRHPGERLRAGVAGPSRTRGTGALCARHVTAVVVWLAAHHAIQGMVVRGRRTGRARATGLVGVDGRDRLHQRSAVESGEALLRGKRRAAASTPPLCYRLPRGSSAPNNMAGRHKTSSFLLRCMTPLNRDRNGATNIGTNFTRLMADQPPIRSMTDEDLAFHRASLCLECD